jgi:hypothetical protein
MELNISAWSIKNPLPSVDVGDQVIARVIERKRLCRDVAQGRRLF